MPAELVFGIVVWISMMLLIIVVGSDLFGMMVDEQIRYLRLIALYAPPRGTPGHSSRPDTVDRYMVWAAGEHREPAGCVHIRHTGRIRYGEKGRWMRMKGETVFSLAVPGYVHRVNIAYAPGIWLEMFDYYVHSEAGMNLNLLSVLPINNAQGGTLSNTSLFRYLAGTPLFPGAYNSCGGISWVRISDSAAKAIIHDAGSSSEALVRFDGRGRIESVSSCLPGDPGTDRPVPGLLASRFSDYTEADGYRYPKTIASELVLPDGEHLFAEYSVGGIGFDGGKTGRQGGLRK